MDVVIYEMKSNKKREKGGDSMVKTCIPYHVKNESYTLIFDRDKNLVFLVK